MSFTPDYIADLASTFMAVVAVPILGYMALFNRHQHQIGKDHQELLRDQVIFAEKQRDEARAAIQYSGAPSSLIARSDTPTSRETPAATNSRKHLFISTPVRGFGEVELNDFVEEVSRLIDGLRATREFGEIFYESYRLKSKQAFDVGKLGSAEYFRELERADVFVAIVPMPSLSGVYFEAGYAAALRKPSIYFTPEGAGKVMPTLMGEFHRFESHVLNESFDSLDHVQRILIEEYGSSRARV